MPRRSTPPARTPAALTPQQARDAVPKLERRIRELKAFEVASVQDRFDPRLDALEKKIDETLVEVFGHDSLEYDRYRGRSIDTAPIYMGGGPSIEEVREGIERGLETNISSLQTAVEMLTERLQALGESPIGRGARAFDDMKLHPELARRVGGLFRDGHFANAIEDACKVLDAFVKLRSGRDDLSGTGLMQEVFSPSKPILRFGDLQTDSEKSEQQGMMFLYAGAMLALRNPRAHGLVPDDAETAVELLGFISFLMKSLDRTRS